MFAFMVLALCALAAAEYRPVVLWHGMQVSKRLDALICCTKGDTCCLPFSMGAVKREIEKTFPGIYVFSIEIGSSEIDDQFAGFFGNVNNQIATVQQQLANDPKLAKGFNAIGFSQGGQFLRGYVEKFNNPPVYNLITFGGQHMGVAELPHCMATNTSICELVAKVLTAGAYADGVRDWQVQAQYFRSPYNMTLYREKNLFLADINNECDQKNETYKQNLISLNKLVLIRFDKDTMVIPRDSEFFGAFAEGSETEVIEMKDQPLYTEDWIGVRTLDQRGAVILQDCPGFDSPE